MFTDTPVSDDQVEEAFGILGEIGRWLAANGRNQRISSTPFESYLRWQHERVNYCIHCNGQLAGIYSLPQEPLSDWPEYARDEPVRWLRALATHPDFRGRGVGEYAISQALEHVDEPVYLDCVSGFLPTYYSRSGFRTIGRKMIGDFDVTLMRHANSPTRD